MKKVLSVIMIMLLCAALLCSCGKKDEAVDTGEGENSVTVFAVISSEGSLEVYEEVEATDVDGDGVITVSDAIASTHDAKYDGGAAAGYLAQDTEYGISIAKLWGVENGGSYGFYLNNAFVDTLLAPVADGDIVSAYSFSDLVGWSDMYSYFDKVQVSTDGEVTLTLTYIGFDENWSPVDIPAANVGITVDGEVVNSVTDENGTVTLTLEKGEHVVSAYTDAMTLVPPVCVVTVG
ncbi:MAG: hypothetical protein IJ017_02605 [Oscillospiraceae bacterium]|nr:hypothetical protein [Oscillospiraceae bacterium]